ncbi:MAG: hypothetical protein L3J13_01405, partial [Devosiaceae bacterium]|nr:hypothetical protein [Devosiaceae bacterium]
QFVITKLVLQSPKINLVIDSSGQFKIPFEFPEIFDAGNLSVAEAQIIDGSIELSDERVDQRWAYKNFNGELSVSGLQGPYGLKGIGEYQNAPYSIRLNLSGINSENQSQSSFFVRPTSGEYSLAAGGMVTFGDMPEFVGDAVLRSSLLFSGDNNELRGDLVVASEIEINADKVLFSAFEIQPDENMAGSRLSGAAVLNLGSNANFNAVVSGGVVGYALMDLREETSTGPIPFLDFLSQLPAPYVPQIPGRIGVDVAELNVHNVALRNVRLDATSDGETWFFEKFQATFAGAGQISIEGRVSQDGGQLEFDGQFGLQSARLGALARSWKDVDAVSTLHNSSGSVFANVRLNKGVMSIENGALEIDDIVHDFEGRITLSDERSLDAKIRLAAMGEKQSERLVSLVPDISINSAFGQVFPHGKIDLTLERGFLFGVQANSLALNASWNSSGVQVERLSAFEFGGAQFSVTGDLDHLNGGSQITGGGRLTLGESAQSGILSQLGERFGIDDGFERAMGQLLPLDVQFDVGPVDENTNQRLSAEGRSGVSNVVVSLSFENPLATDRSDFVDLSASLVTADAVGLAEQIGLGQRAYFSTDEPVEVQVLASGFVSQEMQTEIMAQSGDEYVGYAGAINFSDPLVVSGQGKLSVALQDFSAIGEYSGIKTLFIPGGRGSVDFEFDTSGSYKFENLNFITSTQSEPVTGRLRLTKSDGESTLVGQLHAGPIDVSQIISTIAGPASLIQGDGFWPEGPLDIGSRTEKSRGRIEVFSPRIVVGQHGIISSASFDLVWDASSISLENVTGGSGAGQLRADIRICCSAPENQKQLRARVTLGEVSLSDFVSAGVGDNLSGVLSAGVLFDATGATILEMVNSATGEGSFLLEYAILSQMDPGVFSSLISLSDIAEYDEESLTTLVGVALEQGGFEADEISGVFQLAGGKVRADNIVATSKNARMLADVRIDLADLSLGGGWTLSPTKLDDATGHVDEKSAQIAANLFGDLLAPRRVLDLGQMVEAIKLRALEIELDQLEKLRAEQVARSAEMAANRARLMELEAQRKQEEADRLAAEEEHLRQKQEAAQAAALHEAGQVPYTFNMDFLNPLLLQEQLLLSDPLANGGNITDLPTE